MSRNKLAELVFSFSVKSANTMVKLGQKNIKKRPGRVVLAELVLAELTGNRCHYIELDEVLYTFNNFAICK